MKKQLFFIASILLSINILSAQETENEGSDDDILEAITYTPQTEYIPHQYNADFLFHNELSVSYGYLSSLELINVYTKATGSLFAIGHDDISSFGSVSIEYIRNMNKTIGFGAIVNYQSLKRDGTYHYDWDKTRQGKASEDASYITVMANAKIRWFNFKYVGMYSKIALGFMSGTRKQHLYNYAKEDTPTTLYTNTQKEDITEFSYQLSPIGIEAGCPRFRVFTEFGFGIQGVVNCGIRCGL